ncbi:MAG: 1-acyl-sn-glycerol-3-phosphate acyltransferase [Burkholderiales bacterium]|nr:1-acyl-sn-glycerol-3-phosphate acyltransferase [Burkholderiales bacterium]
MTSYLIEKNPTGTKIQRWALATMQLLGWTLHFRPLPGPRGVIVVYPHTSNWDFLIGVLAKLALGIPFHFIAKSSLFEGLTGATIGRIVRYLGGEPIERGTSTGAIVRLAQKINQADWYWMAIAPEGTRSLKPYWRSGFYHIALAANVPVGCAYFDFKRKIVSLVDYIDLSGDSAVDIERVRAAFDGVQACRPALAGPIAFRPDDATK